MQISIGLSLATPSQGGGVPVVNRGIALTDGNLYADIVGIDNKQVTWGGWFKFTSRPDTYALWSQLGVSAGMDTKKYLQSYGFDFSGDIRLGVYNGDDVIEPEFGIDFGVWTPIHLTVTEVSLGTYNYRLYINGVLIDTMVLPASELNAGVNRLRIGTPTVGADRFVGSIRELRVYERALTIDEIEDAILAEDGLFTGEADLLLARFECNGVLSGLTADVGAVYAVDNSGPFT